MKKKFVLLLVIVLLSTFVIPVFAEGEEGFYSDSNLKLQDPIGTTSFVAGNNVEMSSVIDGLNFVAGNNLSLSSTQDYLFAAGNNLNLEKVNAKDIFLAGSSITLKESNIRDLYAAAQNIRIDSYITRNAYLGGNKVTINSTIEGNVKISAEEIRIGKEAVINGTLTYPKKANISISESAVVANTKTYDAKDFEVETSIKSVILNTFISFLSLLLIAFVLLATNAKLFKKIAKEDQTVGYLFKTAFIGFMFLVLVPVAAIMFMLTVVGIPISIISLFLYGILIYLSMIPTAYYVGTWLLKGKIQNSYLLLTISLLAIYLLRLIPILGGFIRFLSLVLGLGIYANMLKSAYLENKK